MNESQPNNPDFFNPYQVIDVAEIIPNIRPPLPLEPARLYRNIGQAGEDGASFNIKRSILENDRLREFFQPFFGQIVVEIGPGYTVAGYNIALLSGAKAYVGIEPYYYFNSLNKFAEENLNSLKEKSPRIPHAIVEADALSFLKRLPDRSVSIFTSQLESVMKQEYRIAVGQEVQRVLHPQGAFIEYDSEFDLDKNLFKHDLFDKKSDNLHFKFKLEKYQLKKQ